MRVIPRMRVLPDADPGDPGERSPWGYLLWVANKQKRSLAAAAVFDILWLLGLALTPWAIGNAIDEGILGDNPQQLALWVGILLGLALLMPPRAKDDPAASPQEAIDKFRNALRCDLNYGVGYLNLALAYQRAGDATSARACLFRYLELMPQGRYAADAQYRLAEVMR